MEPVGCSSRRCFPRPLLYWYLDYVYDRPRPKGPREAPLLLRGLGCRFTSRTETSLNHASALPLGVDQETCKISLHIQVNLFVYLGLVNSRGLRCSRVYARVCSGTKREWAEFAQQPIRFALSPQKPCLEASRYQEAPADRSRKRPRGFQ